MTTDRAGSPVNTGLVGLQRDYSLEPGFFDLLCRVAQLMCHVQASAEVPAENAEHGIPTCFYIGTDIISFYRCGALRDIP